jgi:FkbM family methyltransferase
MINLILNKIFKRKIIIRENNSELFSIRNFGDSTISRAKNFFSKEPETVKWISSFQGKKFLLDIGANIGVYSLYAAKKGSKVISIEPEFHNFALLNLNIADNQLNKFISAYPISINDFSKLGFLNLRKMSWGGSGHNFENYDKNAYKQGSVSLTLDQLVDELNFCPSLLKIDVDGNEPLVINGAKKLLQNKDLKEILIEINEDKEEHKRLIDVIKSNQFKIKSIFSFKRLVKNYIFERINS